ncbi:hypothetical protein JCM14469_17400 [Desulfatiferula olefinivorans]
MVCMAFESKSGKSDNERKDRKQPKGCYWEWLVDAQIKTFEAWNKDRKN